MTSLAGFNRLPAAYLPFSTKIGPFLYLCGTIMPPMQSKTTPNDWSLEIRPQKNLLDVNLSEVWQYRDLIMLFARRDIVSAYKQTILGPLWFVLQPLFSTFVFTIVFARIANVPTAGVPPVLFYLSGMVCWNFFSSSLLKSSSALVSNSNIFGKVYFPRLAAPISGIISNLVTFGAQFGLFLSIYIGYLVLEPGMVHPTWDLLWFPVVLLLLSALGFGVGLAISALTTKFRDLQFFLGFSIQLLMYASPVIYSLSSVPEKYRWIIYLNPVSPLIELFRSSFLGVGGVGLDLLAYSAGFSAVIVFVGVVLFNQVERTFMDTV
jgi:lipopolysaccharide transport system permease protein